jgi:hypothetical protein
MHHELPQRLDVDWYRKRARDLLRAYRANDGAAGERVHDVVGKRSPIKLSDALHTIAVEHGYTRWPDFKRWLETRSPETRSPEPPIGRIGREPVSTYAGRAQALVDQAARAEPEALSRVRFHVPRLSAFNGGDLALRDARLVVAREYGFPSWRDLVFYADKAIREYEHRPSGLLGQAFELIRTGDVEGLRRMLDADPELVNAQYRGAAATMLEAIAQPDVFGENLGIELGVDPRIVELVIERGGQVDGPLNLAACFNRAELVRMLLGAGASVSATATWGVTPLQTAVYHGAREAGDLLAEVAVVPDALYVAAGAGRLDHVSKWFDANGGLLPAARRTRPNLADIGWPPAPPPRDHPQAVLDEAFALAAYSGRLEVMQYLLDRGAAVDGAAHLGLTGLHLTVMTGRVDTARWLVEHGADLELRDGIHHGTPLGWAAHNRDGSAIHAYLLSQQGRDGQVIGDVRERSRPAADGDD